MWEINNGFQALSLLYSALLGGIYCLFYDILRALRKSREFSDISVFLQDILYFVIITPITFCFLLATTNGEIRAYVLLGIIVGFGIIRFTLSLIFYKIFLAFFKGIFKLTDIFSGLNSRFLNLFEVLFEKLSINISKKSRKAINSFKKLLKKE